MLRNIFKISGLPSKTDITLQKCYLQTFISAPTTFNWTGRRAYFARSCSVPCDTQHRKSTSNIGQRKDELFMRYQSTHKSKSSVRRVKDENPTRFQKILNMNSCHEIKLHSTFTSNVHKKCYSNKVIDYKRTRSDPDPISITRSGPFISISLPNICPEILSTNTTEEKLNVELQKSNSFIELKRQKLATKESWSSESVFPNNFKPRAFNLQDQDFIEKYPNKSNKLKVNISLRPNNELRNASTSYNSMLPSSDTTTYKLMTKAKNSESKLYPDSYGIRTSQVNNEQLLSSKRDLKKGKISEKNKNEYVLHPFANKAAARMILIDANYRSNPQKCFSISSILRSPQYFRNQDWSDEDEAKIKSNFKDVDVFCTSKYQPLYLSKEIFFSYTKEEINKIKKILDKANARLDPSKMSFYERFIYNLERDLAVRMEELHKATKRKYTSGTKLSKKLSGLALVPKKSSNQVSIRNYHVLTKLQDKKLTEKNTYTDLRQLKGENNSLDNLRKTQWRINNYYKWHKLNNMHNVQLTLKRSYSYLPQANYLLPLNNKAERGSFKLKSTRSCTNIAREFSRIKINEIFLPFKKEISPEEFYRDTVNASQYINKDYDEEDRKSAHKEDFGNYVNRDIDEEDLKSVNKEDMEEQEYLPKNRRPTLRDMMNMGIEDLRRKLFHVESEKYDEESDDAKSRDYEENENYSKKRYKRYMKQEGLIPEDLKKNYKFPEKAEYLDETMSHDEPTNEKDNYSTYTRKSVDEPKEETHYSRYEKKADDAWNKVVNYFKAVPGVPSADEFKKKYYRKRAEKYAKLAGLVVLEKEEDVENLSTSENIPNIVVNPSAEESESTYQDNNRGELHLKRLLSNSNKQQTRSYCTLSTNNYCKLYKNTESENSVATLEQLRHKTCINNGSCLSTSANNQIDNAGVPNNRSNPVSKGIFEDFSEKAMKDCVSLFDPEVVSQKSVDSDDEKTVTEQSGEQKEPIKIAELVPSEDKKCCLVYSGNNLNDIIRTIALKEKIFKSIINAMAQFVLGVGGNLNIHKRPFSISMIYSSVAKGDNAKQINLTGSETAPDSNYIQTETENTAGVSDKSSNPEVDSIYSIDSDDFSETQVTVNQETPFKNTTGSSSSDLIISLIPNRCYSKNNADEDLKAINKILDEKDHQLLTKNIVKSIIEATTAQSSQEAAKRRETVVFQPRITPRKMTLAEIIFGKPNDEYEKYFKATCLAAFLDIFRKTEMSDTNFEETEKIKTDQLVEELNKLLTKENQNQEKDC